MRGRCGARRRQLCRLCGARGAVRRESECVALLCVFRIWIVCACVWFLRVEFSFFHSIVSGVLRNFVSSFHFSLACCCLCLRAAILTCVYDMHVGGRLSESAIAAAASSSPASALSFAALTRSLSGVAAANEALHAAFASRLAGLRDACAQAPSFLTASVASPKE